MTFGFLRSVPLVTTCVLIASLADAAPRSGAEADPRVMQLYAAAEYEQALALLGTSREPEAQLYRALCLLALGRHEETSGVVKALVLASPDFTASSEEVPPRFATMLQKARSQLLPGILRGIFGEARARYQEKAFDQALVQFEQLLSLASAADVRDLEGVGDLRVLSEGFVDLAKAAQPPASAIATPVAADRPVRTADAAVVTPARAIKQDMPPWPAALDMNNPIKNDGAVRVQISENGRVTSATMVRTINAVYDLRLLAAARSWEYMPARLNGVAVASESVIEVHLSR
jgi:hypothetical protein